MGKTKKLGLFGYGCVGQGLHDVLLDSKGFNSDIHTIVVKDRNKKRRLSPEVFSFDKNDILENKDIDLVVELIDNAEDAYHIVTNALKNGKSVVSANKKLIAENFKELVDLQNECGKALLYEASVCGGIPIIRNLEEYYDNESLKSVSGIFNGSSNYILTKVIDEGASYEEALKDAQDLGFAESDPRLDVGGFDTKYKLVIVTGHAYGVFVKPDQVFNYGIENLSQTAINYARENNLSIKLVAHVEKLSDKTICAYVLPSFVSQTDYLSNIKNEYNAVVVEAAFSDKQLFIGKGAGGHPTGSAVLSDISANAYDYKYEYKKANQGNKFVHTNNLSVEVFISCAKPSVLDQIEVSNIIERGNDYIVADVALSELIRLKDELESAGAMIIKRGRHKPLSTSLKRREVAEV